MLRPLIECHHFDIRAGSVYCERSEQLTKSYGVGKAAQMTKIQEWVKMRRDSGAGEFPFLRVDPKDNVLLGMPRIMAYLGIRSPATLYTWIELHGLPVVKRIDNVYMTTMTAIDQWLFLASEVENENRATSRGTNARLTLARRRLDDKIRAQEARRERYGRPESDRTEGNEGEGQPQNGRLVDSRPSSSEAEKV